jgi:hypothetical protein
VANGVASPNVFVMRSWSAQAPAQIAWLRWCRVFNQPAYWYPVLRKRTN